MKSLAARLTVVLVMCLLTTAFAQSGNIPAQEQAFINDLAGKTEMVQLNCPAGMVANAQQNAQGFKGMMCFSYDLSFSMLRAQFALYDNKAGAKAYGVRNPPYAAVTPWKIAGADEYTRTYIWITPQRLGMVVFVRLPLVVFNIVSVN